MESGSSAESTTASAPLPGQRTRRMLGSYSAPSDTVSSPETPSIITVRASEWVAAMSATRLARPVRTPSTTHSAPARVLPAPRPPRYSQMRQSPRGGTCASRAQKLQSSSSRPPSLSVRSVSAVSSDSGDLKFDGKDSRELTCQRFADVYIVLQALAFADGGALGVQPVESLQRVLERGERARVLLAIGDAGVAVGLEALHLGKLPLHFGEQSLDHVVQPVRVDVVGTEVFGAEARPGARRPHWLIAYGHGGPPSGRSGPRRARRYGFSPCEAGAVRPKAGRGGKRCGRRAGPPAAP